MTQLLLFEPTEEEKINQKLETLEEKYNTLRKAQFAKISTLQSEVKSMKEQLEFLQSNICRKGYYL